MDISGWINYNQLIISLSEWLGDFLTYYVLRLNWSLRPYLVKTYGYVAKLNPAEKIWLIVVCNFPDFILKVNMILWRLHMWDYMANRELKL